MKYFIVLLLIIYPLTDSIAQKGKSANSKTATVVDSIGAPPRMDGNTGKYDTVRHPNRRKTDKLKRRTDLHYKLESDTIGVERK